MEQSKVRNRLMLAAAVVGLIGVVLLGIFLLESIRFSKEITLRAETERMFLEEHLREEYQYQIPLLVEEVMEAQNRARQRFVAIWLVSTSFAIAAIVLSLIAWKKSRRTMAIAAIPLYFLSLNVISAVLCIVAVAVRKKES